MPKSPRRDEDELTHPPQRGYGYRWQQARLGWLRHHPLCAECERHGRITQASVVDHIQPHNDAHKQRFEKSGVILGCTIDGQLCCCPGNPSLSIVYLAGKAQTVSAASAPPTSTAKGSGKSPLATGIGLYGMTSDAAARAEIYAASTKKNTKR